MIYQTICSLAAMLFVGEPRAIPQASQPQPPAPRESGLTPNPSFVPSGSHFSYIGARSNGYVRRESCRAAQWIGLLTFFLGQPSIASVPKASTILNLQVGSTTKGFLLRRWGPGM